MQATVRGFDPATRSGTLFSDDGTVIAFGPGAFAASGLRLLRPGQRVTIGRDGGGAITSLALAGFALPGYDSPAPGPPPPATPPPATAPPATAPPATAPPAKPPPATPPPRG
jgi:hypothetical protein